MTSKMTNTEFSKSLQSLQSLMFVLIFVLSFGTASESLAQATPDSTTPDSTKTSTAKSKKSKKTSKKTTKTTKSTKSKSSKTSKSSKSSKSKKKTKAKAEAPPEPIVPLGPTQFDLASDDGTSKLEAWAIKQIQRADEKMDNVELENGYKIEGIGYHTRYLGSIFRPGGAPIYLFRSQHCFDCEPEVSIFLFAPKQPKSEIRVGRAKTSPEPVKPILQSSEVRTFLYPGTVQLLSIATKERKEKVGQEARAFIGRCIPTEGATSSDNWDVGFFHYKVDHIEKNLTTFSAVYLNDDNKLNIIFSNSTGEANGRLAQVVTGPECIEIPGENQQHYD